MSEELEHIDAIFSEKLKDYREKPSKNAWEALSHALDEKNQNQEKSNRNGKGKLGLLSITIISFMFIFSGHNSKINPTKYTEKTQPAEKKETILKPVVDPMANVSEMEKGEEPIVNKEPIEALVPTNTSKTNNITQKKIQVISKVEEKEALPTLQIQRINIEKKPPVSILPPQKTKKPKSKGIKIEITLDTTGVDKRAAAPQTKKTFNSIFRKLRKFSEASKKN